MSHIDSQTAAPVGAPVPLAGPALRARPRSSLTLRIPLLVIGTFWICVWVLAVSVTSSLRRDMEKVLSDQQYSLVSHIAGQINEQLENRVKILDIVAESLSRQPRLLHAADALEGFLVDHPASYVLFSGGALVIGGDGSGVADYPAIGRRGVDYTDCDYFRRPLAGEAVVSQLAVDKKSRLPIFVVSVPVRDQSGQPVAALAGVTNLAVTNFLGQLIGQNVGRTGGYMIVSPADRRILMATDRGRIFATVGAADGPMLKRFLDGYQGSGVGRNGNGIEELVSGKAMPVTGWILVATLPTQEAFAAIDNLQQRIYRWTALLSIAFALIVGWMVRRQLAPLRRATRQIAEMGSRGAAHDRLPVDEADEISELFVSFNRLQRRISASTAEADRERAKFAAIFNLTPDPTAIARMSDGRLLAVSRSFCDYFGYAAEDLLGQSIYPGQLDLWVVGEGSAVLRERLETNGVVIGMEVDVRQKSGRACTVLLSGKLIELDGERCCIFEMHDITEKKRQNERLEEIAHVDALTQLPNRRLLADRMQLAMAQCQRNGSLTAVCYLDLDGFKPVNDLFGHAAGDRLLVEIAERLKGVVRGGDTVARVGGDEFVLLLTGLGSEEECLSVLDRMVAVVARPCRINGDSQSSVSASIGVTIFPNDSADADSLLRHADQAMYAAKQAGKNRYHLFDARLEQSVEARHLMIRRIQTALAADELCLYYQPKIDCRRGAVVGAEALIRWNNPLLGVLLPAEFVPLIECDELALAVGAWALRQALHQMDAWNRQGLVLNVSINAFLRHLLNGEFRDQIAAALAEFPGVSPRQLGIEIAETAPFNDIEAIRQVIDACQAMGLTCALDDFGTAYSSLDHLRQMPASELKVDQSLVRNMMNSAEDMAIVEAAIALGRAFHRSVVAEGAETPIHVARLLAMGCDVMQGFALARPMPAAELMPWIRSFRPDPAWSASAQAAPDGLSMKE